MTAVARWKELCMDTCDGEELGRFWASALGLEFHSDDEAGYLTGPTEGHGIAMCLVPEAKTAKHRVHIDVHTPSVAHLEALGASVVRPAEESGLRWSVMSDPEGGELCAFVRAPEDLPGYRFYELVVDARDPASVARWWGERLGVQAHSAAGEGFWWLEGIPGAPFEHLVFQPVPEPKTVKNRTGTCTPPRRSCSRPERACSGRVTTRSAGTCSPTRRETSSAASRLRTGDPGRVVVWGAWPLT